MSYFSQVDPGDTFEPFLRLREGLGFIPNLFRAQTLLPRVIEAEARIAGNVLLREGALSRLQKESLLLVISAAHENTYCATAHAHLLATLGLSPDRIGRIAADYRDAGLSPQDKTLMDFACRLSGRPTSITSADIDGLRRGGFSDEQILEAVLMIGLTEFLCTLSTGLGCAPDFEPIRIRPARRWQIGRAPAPQDPSVVDREHGDSGPYLRAADLGETTYPPFAFFRDRFGFVPNIFRAQTLRPDVVEAEAHVVGVVLLSDDVLSRTRKEYILLVISAANLNTYCVAVHCEMLRALGVEAETSDQIALDHRRAPLSEADKALLDFALKLARRPREFSGDDIEGLRRHGFGETQILEAVVMSSLTNFLNTLQMGLGTVPDFRPRRVFTEETANPPGRAPAPVDRVEVSAPGAGTDSDAHLVDKTRRGDTEAFEDLVRRHHRRVYRTLMGITGNHEDAEDGTQNAFLKAFEHIGDFEGASRFSTWLTRIAINEGVGRLRRRKEIESLDAPMAGADEDEPFRPGDLQAWTDDPEQLYSRTEIRARVERELTRLPAKYRLAVILRDIEHLSIDEAAAAMELGAPTFKTRLSRARLMLREALAPHFARGGGSALRD